MLIGWREICGKMTIMSTNHQGTSVGVLDPVKRRLLTLERRSQAGAKQ